MVSADEVSRSIRGTAAFMTRRREGLREFDLGPAAFRRSFSAIALTAPAFAVALVLTRDRLGLPLGALLGDPGLAALVAAAHLASLLAFPLLVAAAGRRLGLGSRVAAFVIVTNWTQVLGSYLLALPGALLLLGWETPALATLFAAAFATVAVHAQWFAGRAALDLGRIEAAALAGCAWLCWQLPGHLLQLALSSGP